MRLRFGYIVPVGVTQAGGNQLPPACFMSHTSEGLRTVRLDSTPPRSIFHNYLRRFRTFAPTEASRSRLAFL